MHGENVVRLVSPQQRIGLNWCGDILSGWHANPHDAVISLLLQPTHWPESVDFWLTITDGWHCGDALGSVCPQRPKRPVYYTPRLIRLIQSHLRSLDSDERFVCADFWFVGQFAIALSDAGVEIYNRERRSATKLRAFFPLPINDWVRQKKVRRRSGWKKYVPRGAYQSCLLNNDFLRALDLPPEFADASYWGDAPK